MAKDILDVFEAKEMEQISLLIEKLGASAFDFLKLESGDTRIIIGKNGMCSGFDVVTGNTAATPQSGEADALKSIAPEASVQASAPTPAPAPAPVAPLTPKAAADIQEEEGYVILRSPSYGLYYAQSAPGKPPYVEIGSAVKKGTTVGLFEVMKVFCSIEAPVDGEVVEIYVENNQQIEPDLPLMKFKVSS